MAVPHGVGSVWAQGAWEVYWKLVDAHGFDANLYNAAGNAGNQRAMLYVNEGLKNTACNPTFTQVRDGIIQAAADNHGGEDVCRIWEAFAAFGLGTQRGQRRRRQHHADERLQRSRVLPGWWGHHGVLAIPSRPVSDGRPIRMAPTPQPQVHGSAAIRRPPTSSGTKQLGTTVSGTNDLSTGRLAGASGR